MDVQTNIAVKTRRAKQCDLTNWFNQNLAEGLMVDENWFKRHGFSKNDKVRIQEMGLLKEILPGLYQRPRTENEEEIGFEFLVHSLQTQMGIPVHVGGQPALEFQGIIHYIRFRGPWPVYLYTYKKLPYWIDKLKTDGEIIKRSGNKLFEPDAPGLINFSHKYFGADVTMSCRERAMCEFLDEIPLHHSFHFADMYMSASNIFCPKKVQSVLEACKSIKVKRLFLFFAERQNKAWFRKLNSGNVNLGRGKRQIEANGIYNSKYKITVPDNLDQLAGDLVYDEHENIF